MAYSACCSRAHFNPRTPAKECDQMMADMDQFVPYISIHAPPRRSATEVLIMYQPTNAISIHAPPRRSATLCRLSRLEPSENFNPRTPAKECDCNWSVIQGARSNFNPRTPAKECDLPSLPGSPTGTTFQSTHPREGVRHSATGSPPPA